MSLDVIAHCFTDGTVEGRGWREVVVGVHVASVRRMKMESGMIDRGEDTSCVNPQEQNLDACVG